MYSLETNFLKDRQIEGITTKPIRPKRKVTVGEMVPLFAGIAARLIPLAIVAGLWGFVNVQKNGARQELVKLERERDKLEEQSQKLQKIKARIRSAEAEAEAFASVFNQVKPWSAILQDLRDRIPGGVQIKAVKQSEELPKIKKSSSRKKSKKSKDDAAPAAAAVPQILPVVTLEIEGVANNYDAVNDFLLTLKDSKFLEEEETAITEAQLVDSNFELQVPEGQDVEVEFPQVVKYKIVSQLTNLSASELIRELDRKGAVGLVTRIKNLENEGVIK